MNQKPKENLFLDFCACVLFTGFLYFTFEVVLPYAEEVKYEEKKCTDKDGTVVTLQNKENICIKKETLINVN